MLILQVFFGISFLIIIHEFGHFICARLAGVRVEVFSVGFGHRVCGFRYGDTDYRLSLLPLGGYVKVAGDDPTNRHFQRSDDLGAKSFSQRVLFYSGGVIMNVLFAVIAFPFIFKSGVEFDAPMLGEIETGGAAWQSGLLRDDRILKVNGKDTYSFGAMMNEVALAGRRPVRVEVERDGKTFEVEVKPAYSKAFGLQTLGVGRPFDRDQVLIKSVDPESPAYKAGLRAGDRIAGYGAAGSDLDKRGPLARQAWENQFYENPEQEAVLRVRRGDQVLEFRYKPQLKKQPGQWRIGVRPAQRTVFGSRGRAREFRLQRGDIIAYVNNEVFSGGELPIEDMVKVADRPQELAVKRGAEKELVTLKARFTAAELEALRGQIAFGRDNIEHADTNVPVRLDPAPGSPAAAAGVMSGAAVHAIDGKRIATWDELKNTVQAAEDRTLTFVLLHPRLPKTFEIRARALEIMDAGFELDIRSLRHMRQEETFTGAMKAGLVSSVDLIKQLYVTFKRLLTGEVSAKNLGGIITISRVTYHFAEQGWARFFWLLAVLSMNLAFVNILPIPVLDGGHLLFLLVEKVKGSPVSTRVFNYSQVLGLVFLLALLVFVTYNDILRML